MILRPSYLFVCHQLPFDYMKLKELGSFSYQTKSKILSSVKLKSGLALVVGRQFYQFYYDYQDLI